MRIMNFTRRVLSCVLFAACVMTANAVERLMVSVTVCGAVGQFPTAS